jgi:hypothetical protein
MLLAIIALLAIGIPGGLYLGYRAGKGMDDNQDPMGLFALFVAAMTIGPMGIIQYEHLPFVQCLFGIGWAFMLALVGSAASHRTARVPAVARRRRLTSRR